MADVTDLTRDFEEKTQIHHRDTQADNSKSPGNINDEDQFDPLKGETGSFEELNLKPEILRGILDRKWETPSRIQSEAIPAILKRPAVHFIGQAQSGTGKTGAFSLSVISTVQAQLKYPQAICLSPTRELCRQTHEVMTILSRHTGIQTLLVIPGEDIPKVITQQILICTPGRLEGIIKAKHFNLNKIVILVIDEADEMLLQQGQENIATRLIKKLPKGCQRCLFSATFSSKMEAFANQITPQPRTVVLIPPEQLTVNKLAQYYICCGNLEKKLEVLKALYNLLPVGQCVIFVNERKTADKVAEQMKAAHHELSVIHGGDMSLQTRDKVMDSFRVGNTRTLIATNLLARGIDVSAVSLVINYDVPLADGKADCENYLHRVGRSARFGNNGIAITFTHDDKTLQAVGEFEQHFQTKITRINDPQELEEIGRQIEM